MHHRENQNSYCHTSIEVKCQSKGMNMLRLTKAADCLKYSVVLGMDTLIIAHLEVYLLGIVREFQMYMNFIF